jgi:hypothetical protein
MKINKELIIAIDFHETYVSLISLEKVNGIEFDITCIIWAINKLEYESSPVDTDWKKLAASGRL